MHAARPFITSMALFIVVAVTACGCADLARQTPVSPQSAASPGPPRVTVSPETQQTGIVGLGEDAVAEVLVRNEGGAPLTLAVPQIPRGTRVEGLMPELRPGESTRLRFVVDTFEAVGDRQQTWTLVTNDPDRPRVVVRLEVDVRPFLVAQPGYARYITVQHAREGTITQTIAATDGETFRVLRVESPMPTLRIEFREARPDERQPAWTGSQWRIMTTLASDSPVGPVIGPIMVYTDHPHQKRLLIPLSGFVRPMLAVTPPDAEVGDLKRTRTEPLSFFVKNFAEEQMEMTGAVTDVAAVRAELEPIQRGRTWRLKLFVVPGSPLGPFEGKVVLRTTSPKIPRMEVPLSGRLVE
jgi:hypothetical protein